MKNLEIRKAGFLNKGAELMLYSTISEIRKNHPSLKLVVAPDSVNAPYIKRARLELFQKACLYKYRREWSEVFSIIPRVIRRNYGIILDSEVNIVLDAAGFAYTDQWGEGTCRELSVMAKKWRNQGTRVILLPQAFGPFDSSSSKLLVRKAVANIDLIFARDKTSYRHLINICGEGPKIKIAPDFTNIMTGILPSEPEKYENKFCIIPNYRMTQKKTDLENKAYIPLMVKVIRYLRKHGEQLFILVHEGENDCVLAEEIAEQAACDIPIVIEDDPLKVKGILGVCRGVVGSRFHGLVSALSSGVPSLGTGWSHKYEMLFDDYKFPEGLIDVLDWEGAKTALDMLLDDAQHSMLKHKLNVEASRLKKETEVMWQIVHEFIANHKLS